MTTFNESGLKFLEQRNFLLKHLEHYEAAYQGFEWPRLSHFNWALDYFDVMASDNHKTALWLIDEQGETKISFAQMSRRSNQVANFLLQKGVKPFDRIMLMLPNVVALWEITLAAIKLPAVIVPTSTLLTPEELAYRIKTGAIQHVITSVADYKKFATLPQQVNGILVDGFAEGWQPYEDSLQCSGFYETDTVTKVTDPLLQYFTSGTTAKPKLVTHSHQSYTIGHLSTMYWLGVKPGQTHLNISTAGWGKHAWSSFFAPWNAEATVVSYGYPRFNVDNLIDMITQHPISSLCAPPTVWRLLRQKPLAKTHLEQGLSAGEPLNPEVIKDIERLFGFTIREGYGQTETTALIGYCRNQKVIPGTMGYPLPGYQLQLVDEKGSPVSEGELAIQCNPTPVGLMQGYSDEGQTKQVMRDGLYRTGDILAKQEQTYCFIARSDDVFKANGGYRISPFELESALIRHPSILEAAVVPSPDEIKGTVPKAFLVLRPGVEGGEHFIPELTGFLKTILAPSHMIHKFEFCPELPKTSSGKIRRVALKETQ